MKKAIIMLVVAGFLASGCTGSFMLTKKVYNWHRGLGDKWSDEFGFLLCALIPIYGISTFADAIVFNSVEFWTGKNPVEEANAGGKVDKKIVKTPEGDATVSYNYDSKELTIASQKKGLHGTQVTLAKQGNTVITKDQNGGVIYTTVKNDAGDYLVYNKNQQLVRTYSHDKIEAFKEELSK